MACSTLWRAKRAESLRQKSEATAAASRCRLERGNVRRRGLRRSPAQNRPRRRQQSAIGRRSASARALSHSLRGARLAANWHKMGGARLQRQDWSRATERSQRSRRGAENHRLISCFRLWRACGLALSPFPNWHSRPARGRRSCGWRFHARHRGAISRMIVRAPKSSFFSGMSKFCCYRPAPVLALAGVAELADAPDLGSGDESRGGSSPSARTIGPNVTIGQ